jgi:hypothetical protein
MTKAVDSLKNNNYHPFLLSSSSEFVYVTIIIGFRRKFRRSSADRRLGRPSADRRPGSTTPIRASFSVIKPFCWGGGRDKLS